jgi:hypothetical protein
VGALAFVQFSIIVSELDKKGAALLSVIIEEIAAGQDARVQRIR